jgi:hypothetical protein
MSSLDAPLRALSDVIRRSDAPDRLRTSVGDFMAASGVQGEDLRAMTAIPPERWLVYRRLVLNRFVEIVETGLPRTASKLGRERLAGEVTRFIDQRASQSPYLRDIVAEFVAWASQAWSEGPLPRWLIDLARHELLGFEVSSLPEEPDVPVIDDLAIGSPWSCSKRHGLRNTSMPCTTCPTTSPTGASPRAVQPPSSHTGIARIACDS